MSDTHYVLITPARNEAAYIEKTLKSVVNQTLLPRRWVVVSDASTDRTDEIVMDYAARHSFIEFVRVEKDPNRSFASKVFAIRAGERKLTDVSYRFIGNLDADVEFDPAYFETVVARMIECPRLGLAGGHIYDYLDGQFIPQQIVKNSVAGAVQLFRRDAYERIGGYIPLPRGGIDAIAEIMVQMYGWECETFADLKVNHYRPMGTALGGLISARYRDGMQDYAFGNHPLFEIVKCAARIGVRPIAIGAVMRMVGYVRAAIHAEPRHVPADVVAYMRQTQLHRLGLAPKPSIVETHPRESR
ncbi:MAG: glycosyltransferase family 2 protein [Candidatus Hydrogenedentes bacterium]|nr:glycosyltransferase family 2 protein [Candidatus Hydrogenedentota bacterium]